MQTINLISAEIPWLWVGSRATGILAWLAASTTVALGLAFRTKSLSLIMSPRSVTLAHQSSATATMVFTVAHIQLLLADHYAGITFVDLVVPWLADQRTFGVGFGTLAFLPLAAATIASLNRQRISPRTWKLIHMCAYSVWPLATYHYVLAGSDALTTLSAAFGLVALIILVLLMYRRTAVAAAPRKVSPGRTGQRPGSAQ